MDIVLLLALSVHTVAFVIGWGYYGILGRIIIPALAKSLDVSGQTEALVAIERRALPLVLLSVVLFIVTGTYLLLVDPLYEGIGSFGSPWPALMLVKHIFVVALVSTGIVVDYLIRQLPEVADDADRLHDIRWVRFAAEAATGLGAVIVLLTVAAQLS